MINQWQLLWIVLHMLGIDFLQEKTYINQGSKHCPWQYKHCHGKLA
jgi:hypothetical protein